MSKKKKLPGRLDQMMSSLRQSFEQDDTVQFGSDDADNEDFAAIADRFNSLAEVSESIKRTGVTDCGLIFGIDYTLSNKVQGKRTYDGFSLHDVTQPKANPYQQTICILGETLEPFDDDGIIPAFGFGDHVTKDRGIFSLKPEGDCDGFSEVLDVYNERTPKIHLGGPTNFAPLIEKAIEIVKEKKQYHILVIVADGQVTSETATVNSIVKASDYPLSIIVIGVGDGPWDVMETFDDKLPERKFDNFQFVNFHEVSSKARNPQAAVALSALMEIPDQYSAIKRLGLLENL